MGSQQTRPQESKICVLKPETQCACQTEGIRKEEGLWVRLWILGLVG